MNNPPRLRFANLPTPIEALPRLTNALGGPQIWVKRDDLTGLAFGGNKTRKLEFLLAEAQANGARTLITGGAGQSNHCRQTAAAAARFGFECILVLARDPDSPTSIIDLTNTTKFTGNLLLDSLLGVEIVWTTMEARDHVLKETFEKAWETGRRPYLIPYGGSNPTGAVGYVFAIQEMLEQLVGERIPDWIVFASSSGGTQAGLVVGARLNGYRGRILGISVDEPVDILCDGVARLATATADHLGESVTFTPEDILVNADYLGEGYGILGQPELDAIRLFAQKEGLLLDPVYTGRAAAGMIDLIHKGFFSKDQMVLFWHSGGTPALFAERYQAVGYPR